MTTIVTRAGKGSPLTNNEVDTNFTNLNGAKIETLTSTDASVTITGTGDSRNLSVPINPNAVSGPASATDNAVARFDGTTGKLIQNSTAATIDDSGNADFLSQKADFFDIDTAATTSAAVGRLRWDASKGTAVLGEVGGNLEIAVGQTLDALVTNAEAVTITKGQVVYLFSATGNRASVKLAYNTGDATSAKTFGVAAENIAANGTGLVRCVGVLDGLNLGSYTAGDTLYLGATAGSLTATKPYAPNHLVYVGLVERANNGNGQMYVRVQNGYELDEIHDVQINSGTLANGQTILYDVATSLWKNANLTAGTGVSITNGASSVTIANTGVTQATAGTGISVSAGTGNVTITNTGVTSVTGTSPVASSGGATPAISLASGYGDTQNPYASKTANNFLAAPNGTAGVPTFRAIVAADIPTLNQNTTGTASNVTGTVAIANGGTGATTAPNARTNLGATTVGSNLFTLTNPSAVTFPRFNADNTVSALDAATFRSAIGAGTGNGTVTSVGGTGTVNGITLSGTVTSSGNLTLGGALSGVSLSTQVTGTLPIANGGTGATTRQDAMDALAGAVTSGQYLRGNGTDVVMSAIQAGDVPTLNQNTTGSAATFTSTTQNSQFNSIGVNTAASGTAGEIRATNNVTAYYSDERLKIKLGNIPNALEKVNTLDGFYYQANEIAQSLGYEVKQEVGVSAQQVQAIMPEVVAPAPIDDKYLTVRYERLVPLLIEAIKELSAEVKELREKVGK